MKIQNTALIYILIAALFLSGCNLTRNSLSNTSSISQTSIAKTIAIMQTSVSQTNPTLEANLSLTETRAAATIQTTPLLPTALPTTFTTPAPTYRVANVADITVVDGTVFPAGETFTKTWEITNGGTSSWTPDFKLVYFSGSALEGPSSVLINQTVAPGQIIDLSIDLVAPEADGTYTGYYMLQTPDGTNFGIGNNGTEPFWVSIVVGEAFQVTSAVLSVFPSSYDGPCPGLVEFTATITASAAGVVTFHYATSTGNSSTYTMVFNEAGTITSDALDWIITGPDNLKAKVYIDSPNSAGFEPVTIPVTCAP